MNDKELKKNDDEKEFTGEQEMVVLSIPKCTSWLKIIGKMIDKNGEVIEYNGVFDLPTLKEMREDYLLLDPDDCAFDTYALTEEGKKYLEELERSGAFDDE